MKRQAILLMTDTTRCDMLGCYGDERMKTPSLDSLASEGIRYTQAYTAQPVCGPARSAIFSGTFPHSNGVITNCMPYGANVKTIGQRLRDNGILAGYTGKWHLDGGDYFGFGIPADGWDRETWYDMHNYLEELSVDERLKSRKSSTAYESWPEEMCYAHRTVERALDFIEKHKDEDYFLVISLDEPHGPCLCPEPYVHMYDGFSFSDDPVFHDDLKTKNMMQRLWAGEQLNAPDETLNRSSDMLSLFLGCNSYADHELGRVIDKIHETNEDAFIIYTSDHGDMLGAHRLQGKNAAFYKEICNIPLIVRYGKNSPVTVSSHPVSHLDLAPTILEYFSIPIPKLFEGRSILGEIKSPELRTNEYVFTEFTRYEVDHDGFGGLQMMRAVTDGRYKLSINLCDRDEFYDTQTDPAEVENLIDDESYWEIRNKLHDVLLRHMDDTRDTYRGYQWGARPWRKDFVSSWNNSGCTRQRENEEYEPRQWDYDTGLPMKEAVRGKKLYDEKK